MIEKTTLLYFEPSGLEVTLFTVDKNQKVVDRAIKISIAELPNLALHSVYIIVPQHDVLITELVMPKLTRARLLQALPFALEEQIIDDVESLHFAIGQYSPNKPFPVAIVNRAKMKGWQALCKEHHIEPRAFIPAIFILPFTFPDWQVNTIGNECLVRTNTFTGFACEKDNLDLLLNLKLAEEQGESKPNIIYSELPVPQLIEQAAIQITTLPFINLLQSNYRSKRNASNQIKKIWLTTAILVAAWFALLFAENIASYSILKQRNNQLETAINTVYKKNFPQSKSIVAPRERLSEKLHRLTNYGSSNTFLLLLAQLGKGLSQARDVHIQNLTFRDRQFLLEVTSSSFDNLDTLTQQLTQLGLLVKQQNAATSGSEVKATLMIKAGA